MPVFMTRCPWRPSPGDDLTFGGGSVGTITLGSNRLANSIHFTSGFALDASGAATDLNISTGSVVVDPSISATINSVILSPVGLNFSGAGMLTLTNTNTYSTGTIIAGGGTLAIYADTNLGSASTPVSFNAAGGSLVFLPPVGLPGLGGITNSTRSFVLNAAGNFNIASGQLVSLSWNNYGICELVQDRSRRIDPDRIEQLHRGHQYHGWNNSDPEWKRAGRHIRGNRFGYRHYGSGWDITWVGNLLSQWIRQRWSGRTDPTTNSLMKPLL